MGRFHGFNLAEELHRRGNLLRLITTYPKFVTRKFGLPDSLVTSLLPIGAAERLCGKVKGGSDYFFHELFDRSVSRMIPQKTEIFIGWSSSCLHSLRRAKALGARTVVDEGSSHIFFQKAILTEEYARFGLKPRLTSKRIVEKELKEYEEADYVNVPSTFAYNTFLRYGVSDKKLRIIPYGVRLDEFKPVPKEDDSFRVIFAGALSLRKGVHYLLQAFSELNLPKAELWLIGAVEREIIPFLKRFANEKIRHLGPFKQSDLFRYYSQGSVFCLPSITEGFGIVLPQAMACGLPIIATTNTGGPDLITDGREGFIVPIRDIHRLKEKILYLYEHPDERKGMGESAHKRVSENFTWRAYGTRILAAYQN